MSKIIVEQENTQELKTLVKGALENEIKIISIGIRKTQDNLRELEDRYEMDSETFYKRYSDGEMGDRVEYIRWAGELETLKRLQKNLAELSEVEIC